VRWGGQRAFSRLELTVVVALLFFIAILQVPARSHGLAQTRRAQCVANLRRLTLAFEIYANENGDKLPPAAGYWAWDFPWALATNMSRYGASMDSFYCPANLDRVDLLWSYAEPSYRVIGYATTLPGGQGIAISNANPTLTPRAVAAGPTLLAPPRASERVLVADSTVSQEGQNNEAQRLSYKYDTVYAGYAPPPRATAHMDDGLPEGGNLGMLDGHVEWRRFADMHPRTDNPSAPTFWW
jgi:prepilin-type processing-associated H-X9-DG protein